MLCARLQDLAAFITLDRVYGRTCHLSLKELVMRSSDAIG